MSTRWYYSQDGAQYGPVDESEVIRLIQTGEIPPGVPVCFEGGDEWRPAREYNCFQVEVFPVGKAPAVNPATPVAPSAQAVSHNPPQPAPPPPSSPAPIVMNPAPASVAAGNRSMSGMTVACIVIMIIITIGSVSFSFLQSQKLNDLEVAKSAAEADALRANQDKRDAVKKAKDASTKAMAAKDGEFSRLMLQLQTASQRPTRQDLQSAVAAAKAASSSQIQTLQNERDAVQDVADQVPTLQSDLTAYTVHGTAKEIKAQLDELKKLKEGAAPPPVKPKTKPVMAGEIAVINSYDQLNGFYILNRGSDIGIQEGAKFTIFRNARAVGKIVIIRARPTVSIAVFDPALGKPTMPFKVGDKVMKLN